MIKLSQEHINYLSTQPEQGMGYHLVTVILNNGTILKERTVLNGAALKLQDGEEITPNDIKEIIIK